MPECMSLSLFARNLLVCGALAVSIPAVVSGQTNSYLTNGAEYAIAGSLGGDQVHPALSLKSTGGYLVWEDNLTDGDGLGISARRLDSTLSGSYSTFRVNAAGTNDQERPQVSLLSGGGAVFVWQGGRRSYQHIYARFLSAGGTWVTPSSDVRVNSSTNTFQVNPVVATLANSNVVVAWGSFNEFSSSSMQDVYARVFTPAGQAVGSQFLVNSFTSYNQRTPAIASLRDGRFVIAWVSEQERFENSVDIYAQIFSASGTKAGNEILISSSTNVCANPSVVPTSMGGFIVAWSEKDLTSVATNSWDVCARAFGSTGTASGASVRINQFRFGDQYGPRLAIIGSDVVAVWTSMNQDGSREGVVGRFLGSNLTPAGDEFVVNTATSGPQIHPVVAADGQARFLFAWGGFVSAAAGMDLFAQRYASTLLPPPPPDPPFVTVLSSNALTVSWPAMAGYQVACYEVYADGATTPTASVTNTWWTMTGLAPASTHRFQLDYLLADGRYSDISGATTNSTYGTLTWGGIPYEWMIYYFGTDLWSWFYQYQPQADSDGDGVSNLNEFLAGTCPTNAASVLRTSLQPTSQGFYLNWNTQPGLIYQVQTSTNLKSWTSLGGMRFAADDVDWLYVGGSPASYYRVLRVR